MDERKVQTAIERIKTAQDMSRRYMNDDLYIMISGGKDSSVIQQLAVESGIKCHFVHSLTTVDAPDTVYFVRSEFKRLEELGYDCKIRRPPKSMWQLIIDANGLPPLRTMRYCCHAIKERPVRTEEGKPAFICTGVRWAESTQRKTRGEFEALASKKDKRVVMTDVITEEKPVLSNDNELNRKLFEDCKLRSEKVVNPIIDWSEEDVWDYIKDRELPYNPLYDRGFKRIGCVGCPMQNPKERARQFEMYPKFKDAYIRAFELGMKKGIEKGKEYTWKDGGERYLSWILERGLTTSEV